MTIYSQSEELVSRCVECDLAEPESLTSLGGSAPGVVDGILSGYTRDEDGTIADPRKYAEKILESYEKLFGNKPKKTRTPLSAGDHPEMTCQDFVTQIK